VGPFTTRRSPGVLTIAAVAVAAGLLPLPSEYYVLLRLFLCGLSLYYLASTPGAREAEKWILVGLAVVHNPLVPIELGSRTLSSLVDVATVAFFWYVSRRAGRLHR
jgi:hypothetical protein